MISHKHKLIFTAIPRTGSQTFRQIMDEQFDAIYPSGLPPHASLYEMKQVIEPKHFDSYFKFGIVRNPWDRVVSMYTIHRYHEKKDGRKPKKFEPFVEWIENASDTMPDIPTKRLQLDWLRDPGGQILVDWIGRFEHLKKNVRFIIDKFGVKLKKIPHRNPNRSKRPYVEFYNKKTRQIIADKFAEDIDYFGYKFGK